MNKDDPEVVGHFLFHFFITECEWCEDEKECLLGGRYGDGSPTCLDCARQIVARFGERGGSPVVEEVGDG